MADFWKVNQTSTNGAERFWHLIETLVAAGWAQVEAGSNHADFDVKYPASIGGVPGMVTWQHLDVVDAWIRMQDPAGGREFTLQRKASATTWVIAYSKLAKFIGGTPSATVRSTAADELEHTSNVTNLSPAVNSHHHCWASNVSPYPFYIVAYPAGGGNYNHLLMMDKVTDLNHLVPDPDPVVWVRGGNNTGSVYSVGSTQPLATSVTLSAWGWTTAPSVLNIFQYIGSTAAGYRGFSNNELPPLIGSTKDLSASGLIIRIPTLSDSATKGLTTYCRFAGASRSQGDTYAVSSARDRLYVLVNGGALVLPWNSEIPLV